MPLDTLPNELLDLIVSYLTKKEAGCLRLVNTKLANLNIFEHVSLRHLRSELDLLLSVSRRYPGHIKKLTYVKTALPRRPSWLSEWLIWDYYMVRTDYHMFDDDLLRQAIAPLYNLRDVNVVAGRSFNNLWVHNPQGSPDAFLAATWVHSIRSLKSDVLPSSKDLVELDTTVKHNADQVIPLLTPSLRRLKLAVWSHIDLSVLNTHFLTDLSLSRVPDMHPPYSRYLGCDISPLLRPSLKRLSLSTLEIQPQDLLQITRLSLTHLSLKLLHLPDRHVFLFGIDRHQLHWFRSGEKESLDGLDFGPTNWLQQAEREAYLRDRPELGRG